MYLLYSFLLTTAFILGLPYFVYRGLRSGKYWASLKERLGLLPPELNREGRPSIWIHAVSVGEVIAARTLLPLLRESFPENPIFISVTTLTGRQIAERQLQEADGIFYCPFDWGFIVRRVVARIRPCLLLLVDTEIWPHLIRACRKAGGKTLLINGRISDRSYPRYRWIRPFLRKCLRYIDCFCMQSSRYAERIVNLGADPARVQVTGSIKFDAGVPGRGKSSVAAGLIPTDRPVLVVGSSLAPEEDILLEAFESLRAAHPDLFLVLAPRHPDRFAEVAELASLRGLRVVKRTTLTQPPVEHDVMVLDTIGELASIYGRADLVFVGGSLAPWGGHNLVEPAVVGKPIVFGPNMSNFREMAKMFLEAEAAIQVRGREALQDALERLMNDSELRRSLGENARQLVEANRGAGRKTVEIAFKLLKDAAEDAR
jgi:3-deoxy-D-manno-octulosonic-acid transferase